MSETIDDLILDIIRKAQEVSIAAENGYGWVCEQDALDDAKDALRARVAALEAENAAMREAFTKIMQSGPTDPEFYKRSWTEDYTIVRNIAREALKLPPPPEQDEGGER